MKKNRKKKDLIKEDEEELNKGLSVVGSITFNTASGTILESNEVRLGSNNKVSQQIKIMKNF